MNACDARGARILVQARAPQQGFPGAWALALWERGMDRTLERRCMTAWGPSLPREPWRSWLVEYA